MTYTVHCPCKTEIMQGHLDRVRETARQELGFDIGEIELALGCDPGDDEPDDNGNLLVARFIHSEPGAFRYHASTAWTWGA